MLPIYTRAIANLTMDDTPQSLDAAFAAIAQAATRLVVSLDQRIRDWIVRVEQWHRRRFAGGILSVLGIDIAALISDAEATEFLSATLSRNSSLIRGLSDDLRRRVEQAAWTGYANQTPRAEMAKELTKALSIGKPRAHLIARDQTVKLAAGLDQLRQEALGITKYTWRHSRKAHPRAEHVARNGRVFEWKQPPSDGHPGHAINCGCKAQALVEFD